MNDFFKWLWRSLWLGLVWVFILSVTWSGKPLFYHLNQLLVQNELVRTADYELAKTWDKLVTTARLTFREAAKDEPRF